MLANRLMILASLLCGLVWQPNVVWANAANAKALCAVMPNAAGCSGGQASCATCHTGAPALNAYGQCLKDAMSKSSGIEDALKKVMRQDCDGDGVSNSDELAAGTSPAQADHGRGGAAANKMSCEDRGARSGYNLCGYDHDFAFKRVYQNFCGVSPSFDVFHQFKQKSVSEKERQITETASECMKANFWRGKGGIVWDMAGVKVRPLSVIKTGDDAGDIPLADYYDDYNLYIYHQLDDVDVRGVLTANYYITRRDGQTTTYNVVDSIPLNPTKPGILAVTGSFYNNTQQFVPKDKRAGVLSTSWTQIGLTMFASIPRSTAAHFYRVYLGLDISKNEGLVDPGANFNLIDYDSKDVTRPACAACHRSLDALAYPFTRYNGLTFQILGKDINSAGGFVGGAVGGSVSLPPFLASVVSAGSSAFGGDLLLLGEYSDNRIKILSKMNAAIEPDLAGTPSAGAILGRSVSSLPEWGRVAANSNEFARKTVLDYWMLLIGTEPDGETQADFDSLVENLKTKHKYHVREMLLDLITRDAYGAP